MTADVRDRTGSGSKRISAGSVATLQRGMAVIRVDYSKYLETQKVWAESLTRRANLDGGATDREATLLAILALDRLIAMSIRPSVVIGDDGRQEFPGDDSGPEFIAA